MRESDFPSDDETKPTAELHPGSRSIAAVVAVPDAKLRRLLLDALDLASIPVVDENCEFSSADALLVAVERLRPELVFLGVSGLPGDPDPIIARLTALNPAPRVVAVHDKANPEVILKLMRAGASEFVYLPFDSQAFEESLNRVLADCARAGQANRVSGGIIGFVSAKGGCGATTLACHVSSYLHRATKKGVLLADLDMASGIAGAIMQTNPRYTVQDAFQNLHRMDLKLWKSIVTAAPSGVDVIPAVPDPPSSALGIRRIPPIFRFWRAQYDYTIVDMGHGLTQDLLDALDSMDSLVLVATNEMLALRQAKHMIQALASRNFGSNRLRLVLNRMPKRPQIPVAELEKVMGQPIYAVIPNDYPRLNEAYSEPRLLDPGADLSVQIGIFAARLTGIGDAEKKRRGLFGLRRKN